MVAILNRVIVERDAGWVNIAGWEWRMKCVEDHERWGLPMLPKLSQRLPLLGVSQCVFLQFSKLHVLYTV